MMQPTHLRPGVSVQTSVSAFAQWAFWSIRTPTLQEAITYLRRIHPQADYVAGELWAVLWQPGTPRKPVPPHYAMDPLVLLSEWVQRVVVGLPAFGALAQTCERDLHATRVALGVILKELVNLLRDAPKRKASAETAGAPVDDVGPGNGASPEEETSPSDEPSGEPEEGEEDSPSKGLTSEEAQALGEFLANEVGLSAQARMQRAVLDAQEDASMVRDFIAGLYGRTGEEMGPMARDENLVTVVDLFLQDPKFREVLAQLHQLQRRSRSLSSESALRPRPGPPRHAGFVADVLDADLTEQALLVLPQLKPLFLLRAADEAFQGVVEAEEDPVHRGDLILLLDGSGSMGRMWTLAKAFAVALAQEAYRHRQEIRAALFNTCVHPWFSTEGQTPAETVVHIMCASPGGGTSILHALLWAEEKIRETESCDVVLVTDGLDPALPPEVVQRVNTLSGDALTVVGIGGSPASWEHCALFEHSARAHFVPTQDHLLETFAHILRSRR